MSDLIRREAAINTVFSMLCKWDTEDPEDLKNMLLLAFQELPSAQPERKTGKWINHRNDDGHNIADCNQCGNAIQWFDGDEIPRYCCMCGARLREEEE